MSNETNSKQADTIRYALKAADATLKANPGNEVIERNVMTAVRGFWDALAGRNGRTLEGGAEDARFFLGLDGVRVPRA